MENLVAHFHLPGAFEFCELYRLFLSLYKEHREYFYEWSDISSVYGSPTDCLWGGGRCEDGTADPKDVLDLLNENGISARLTFSNSLLTRDHLSDKKCNSLCKLFSGLKQPKNGVIVHSQILIDHIKENYPDLYLVSSTTKVILDEEELIKELDREDFSYVVPDFRFNKRFDFFDSLTNAQKGKVELLCNECCYVGCNDRKTCYESVSHINLGDSAPEHVCTAPGGSRGYLFSKAMENPMFISVDDIKNTYLPKGITNFKIEGRGLGSAMVLEMLIYYLVKPEYQIHVREAIYLGNSLDLF